MATEEHKDLAFVIKQTHALLREEYRNYGAELAWQRHISQNNVLQKYADSMQKLALIHWKSEKIDKQNDKRVCRIKWVTEHCKEYFFYGGRERYAAKELEIKKKIEESKMLNDGLQRMNTEENLTVQLQTYNEKHINELYEKNNSEKSINQLCEKITLLDVGSCFNPFEKESSFEVTAIDLFTVPGKVYKCDFVNVKIGKEKIFSQNMEELQQLPENSYDTVVFALFLGYLPCPELRYLSCRKAYDLLKNEGILFIVAPDSKHVGANAKIMKSWRYILSKMGFMRIKYAKFPHIHCSIFRKCIFKNVATRWADLQKISEDDPLYVSDKKIFIPQDFQSSISPEGKENNMDRNDDDLLITFNELPFSDN